LEFRKWKNLGEQKMMLTCEDVGGRVKEEEVNKPVVIVVVVVVVVVFFFLFRGSGGSIMEFLVKSPLHLLPSQDLQA